MNSKKIEKALRLAKFIQANKDKLVSILSQYQSYEVTDDEIERSVETLENISEISDYFDVLVDKISVFLPLNLSLYSFILFVVVPSFQTENIVVRPPEKMKKLFRLLEEALCLYELFPNISYFYGTREDFVSNHCAMSDVIIFTGKYENFLKIRTAVDKSILVLHNGVGHNPIVVTEAANIDLAVKKTVKVKIFNNGQDCAGADMILVHSSVLEEFTRKLISELKTIKVSDNYNDKKSRIGPLFETDSVVNTVTMLNQIQIAGGKIIYGGMLDYTKKIIWPVVCLQKLKNASNYKEIYSPVFTIFEYEDDSMLSLYFNDEGGQYREKQMYVSIFGHSEFIANNIPGSIPLLNVSVHDIERGTEEYGGYSREASSVSINKMVINKPLLIPREIHTFLNQNNRDLYINNKSGKKAVSDIIQREFVKNVKKIFKRNIVFAYIFGSFGTGHNKSYSDLDTFICVNKKDDKQIKEYLGWLFVTSQVFGMIPDFKYPTEIVEYSELKDTVEGFSKLSLNSSTNSPAAYAAMVWVNSLSMPKLGIINAEAIPIEWLEIFPLNSARILRTFLADYSKCIQAGQFSKNYGQFQNIPVKRKELDNFIKNLSSRRLVDILKYIKFEDETLYDDMVQEVLLKREFFGRKFYNSSSTKNTSNPYFRFGVVDPL